MYDYKAEREDELNLVVGDTVTVLKKQEDDWWLGVSTQTGKQGVFPSTFVEEIHSTDDNTSLTPTPNSSTSHLYNSGDENNSSGGTPPVNRQSHEYEETTNAAIPPPIDSNGDTTTSHSSAGDWQEVFTEQGEKYYYNTVTGESAWELPS